MNVCSSLFARPLTLPQASAGRDLIHVGEEVFAACLLALTSVFNVGKLIWLMSGSDQVVWPISAHLTTCSQLDNIRKMIAILSQTELAKVNGDRDNKATLKRMI